MLLEIARIRMDGGTQPREQLDMLVISDYAGAMAEGAKFPPVVAFHDGETYWLADGFHRVRAALQAGLDTIEAEVRQGTRRDAVLESVGANADHGLRRSNADKRRAVITLLKDDEWRDWSDSEIARRTNVDHKTVGSIRRELEATWEIPKSESRMGADGRVINTSRIGTSATTASSAPLPNQPPFWPDDGEGDEERAETEDEPGGDDGSADDRDDDAGEAADAPAEHPAGTMFVCEACKEVFDIQVWHCPKCDHHWTFEDEECRNCRKAGRHYEVTAGTAMAQASPELTAEDMEQLEAEKRAEAWLELLDKFAMMTNTIQRRGGIAELAATWPPNQIPRAISFLEKARDTFDSYASTLKEIING